MKLIHHPYADHMLDHPVFRLEARRSRWGRSFEALARSSRRAIVWMHLVILGLWGLVFLLNLITANMPPDSQWLYSTGMNIVNGLILALVGASVLLDFWAMQAALKTWNADLNNGRWELLSLTALNEWGIVRAKHAAVRLKVWRVAVALAGARLASVNLGLLIGGMTPYILTGENLMLATLVEGWREEPLTVLVLIITGVLVAGIYVLEPFWHMQAMTALGMVLSVHIMNAPLALLAAGGVLLIVWILQTFVALALMLGLGVGLGVFFAPLTLGAGSLLATSLYLLGTTILSGLTIYGFFALLQQWSLRTVLRRLQHEN